MVRRTMEIGIYSFGDRHPDPLSGKQVSVADQYDNTLARITLAEQVVAQHRRGRDPGDQQPDRHEGDQQCDQRDPQRYP